jgi:hypothetical protein
MKFLADEAVDKPIVDSLRSSGYDSGRLISELYTDL